MVIDRNTIKGFSQRAIKNTEFIIEASENDDRVHAVTQLILSLLGLVVFPYQKLKEARLLPDRSLDELYAGGWPHFSVA